MNTAVWQKCLKHLEDLQDDLDDRKDETKEIALIGFDAFYDWLLDETSVINIESQTEHGSLRRPILSDSSISDCNSRPTATL